MRYTVTFDGAAHTLDISADAQGRPRVLLDGAPLAVDRATVGPGHLSLLIAGRSYDVFAQSQPGDAADTQRFAVLLDGTPLTIDLVDERRHQLAGLGGARRESGEVIVKAPMPGLVVGVLVAVGEAVERGQRVAILEAMKMQNDLTAPRAGVVRAVRAAPGAAVTQGQPLLVIGDPAGAPPAERDELD